MSLAEKVFTIIYSNVFQSKKKLDTVDESIIVKFLQLKLGVLIEVLDRNTLENDILITMFH